MGEWAGRSENHGHRPARELAVSRCGRLGPQGFQHVVAGEMDVEKRRVATRGFNRRPPVLGGARVMRGCGVVVVMMLPLFMGRRLMMHAAFEEVREARVGEDDKRKR